MITYQKTAAIVMGISWPFLEKQKTKGGNKEMGGRTRRAVLQVEISEFDSVVVGSAF
jgi:hypothetical protein